MPILRQIAQLGQPVLRESTRKIDNPLDPSVQALIDDMLVTVADANGVGIAATQVYESLALFIVASRPKAQTLECVGFTPKHFRFCPWRKKLRLFQAQTPLGLKGFSSSRFALKCEKP